MQYGTGELLRNIMRAVAISMFVASPSFATDIPDDCDSIPGFSIQEPYSYDKKHLEIVKRLQNLDEIGTKDVKELTKIRDKVAKKFGRDSAPYAILSFELASATAMASGDYDSEAKEHAKAFELLFRVAKTKPEVDYLASRLTTYVGSFTEEEQSPLGRPAEIMLNVVRRHVSLFGQQVRQIALLHEAVSLLDQVGVVTGLDQIALGREIETIAKSLGSARGLYSADVLQLAGLSESGRQVDAAALATRVLPEVKARLEHMRAKVMATPVGTELPSDCWNDQHSTSHLRKTLGSSAEIARLEMLDAMTFHVQETHGIEVWFPYLQLLTLRPEDPGSFREALRYGSRNLGYLEADEIGFALGAAAAMEQSSYPALAREYLSDAWQWSLGPSTDPSRRFAVAHQFAAFEWSSGNSSNVDDLIESARTVASASADSISSDQLAGLDILEAKLADARLRDDDVVEAVEGAVLAASRDDADREPDDGESGGGSVYLLNELFQAHLQGQFCLPCAERLKRPLEQWWHILRTSDNAGEWNTGSQFRLLALAILLSDSQAVDAKLRKDAATTLKQALADESNETMAALEAEGVKHDEALLLAALELCISQRMNLDDPLSVAAVLREKDIEKKRVVARRMAEAIWDFEAEFTGVAEALVALDSYIRLVSDAKYPLSARVITEELVWLSEREENGQSYLDTAARLQLARQIGAAHARLASYAFQDRDWKAADEHVTTAMDLMTSRLRKDWRAGSERAILLYRSFQPAMKLAAQIRFLLANDREARAALPGVDERAFVDLQIAMLGETAFATQAATQARILRDEEVASAFKLRDEAAQRVERLEAVQAAAPASNDEVYTREHEQAVQQLSAAEEHLAALLPLAKEFSELRPRSLSDVQKTLRSDEALLVLHSGGSNLYGLAVRPSGPPSLFVSSIGVDDLSAKIAQLRREVATYGSIDLANSQALYSLLLAPASDALSGAQHLIVVGDGPVLGVPWGALSYDAAANGTIARSAGEVVRGAEPLKRQATDTAVADWGRIPWLIRKFPVSIVPGIAALDARTDDLYRSSASQPFLGIGNPNLGGSKTIGALDLASLETRSGSADAAALASLAPLPETENELIAIAQSLGASSDNLLLADEATEQRLRAEPLHDYRVLHFATHGVLAGEVSGYAEPGLVLTPEDSGAADQDGYLSLSEIMALKLDADLVILSACNTGGADGRPRSEWMSGLTRGFISAGAQQLLVTLWSIPSDPTVRLITGMASSHQLDPEHGWPHAIQASILKMLDDPAHPTDGHPASWAGFVMFGSGAIN